MTNPPAPPRPNPPRVSSSRWGSREPRWMRHRSSSSRPSSGTSPAGPRPRRPRPPSRGNPSPEVLRQGRTPSTPGKSLTLFFVSYSVLMFMFMFWCMFFLFVSVLLLSFMFHCVLFVIHRYLHLWLSIISTMMTTTVCVALFPKYKRNICIYSL